MLNRIIGASATLRAFLEARVQGASADQLRKLKIADEAARDHRTDVVVEFKPDRERNGARGRDKGAKA